MGWHLVEAKEVHASACRERSIMDRGTRIACLMVLCALVQVPGACGAATADRAETPAQAVKEDNGRVPPKLASGPKRDVWAVGMADAERLAIRFQGYPELSGEYRINPDGAISVPVIGRFNVINQTAAQLEKILATRTGEIAGREVYVTVETAAYKPVFVTGLVKNPGSVQWFPSMTVLQALSVSGGIYRADGTARGDATTGSSELARFKKALDQEKRSIAELARIRAEQRDASVIEVPAQLIKLVGPKEAGQLIKTQTVLLESRRTSFADQLASLERGRVLAGQELTGLKEQSLRIKDLLRLRTDARQKVQELLSKGLVPAFRALDEEIKVSELEDKITNTAVALARVQATVANLEREAMRTVAEKKAQLEAEAVKLESEIAQLDIEAEASRDAYPELTGNTTPDNPEKRISFKLVRNSDDERDVIPAEEATFVRPGDVLVVAREQ
jgi:exopolysaccharide production protein ExoF